MGERRPDFLIVGAPKSGTTAVYAALRSHPQVFMPGLKEPHFFCEGMGIEGWDEYLALFDAAGGATRVGEASTNYLSDPAAPGRIREALGPVRIVVFARHPVDQMHSAYHHNRRTHLEELDFASALEAEGERTAAGASPMLLYRRRAELSRPLERYRRAFGAERVHLAFHDDLEAEPARVLRELARFLEIDEAVELELPRVNRHGRARSGWLSRFLARPKPLPAWAKRIHPSTKNRLKRLLREWNTRPEPYGPMPAALRERLSAEVRADLEALADASSSDVPRRWLESAATASGAPADR